MEKIKVNMNPNPLDVQTIHASQNDGEARQWEFELHNNGDVIDASEISDQLVFKAYKGGTEQILPENGSVPTTSPIIADIKYPQGELTDQEFLYRESPTESDGLAKITDIKGNTLVWNQLINATDGSGTIGEGVTYTTSNGVITLNGTPTSDSSLVIGGAFSAKANHKYLLKGCPSGGGDTTYQLFVSRSSVAFPQGNRLQDTGNGKIVSALGDENNLELRLYVYSSSPTFSNTKFIPQIFDLTAMGLDSLTNAEILQWFANYFPLSYYSYNQGTLLSFMGNGIKTVGFNQWDEETAVGYWGTDGLFHIDETSRIATKNLIKVLPSTEYYVQSPTQTVFVSQYDSSMNYIRRYAITIPDNKIITDANCGYIAISFNSSYGTTYNNDICINISDAERNGTYEPYTSSTLSLPISTYFPTGMKSAGNVYDEWTPIKATARIGTNDLGMLGWNRMAISEGYAFVSSQIENMVQVGNVNTANVLCPSYTLYMSGTGYSMPNDKTYRVGGSYFGTRRVIIRDDSYTDATAFKTAMNGIPLYFELATPTETSFTTASLVTENAEIPLSNEDGTLIGKCTEQLSSESGFFDAKIKLADEDGECYSNKIQLHIERSPQ